MVKIIKDYVLDILVAKTAVKLYWLLKEEHPGVNTKWEGAIEKQGDLVRLRKRPSLFDLSVWDENFICDQKIEVEIPAGYDEKNVEGLSSRLAERFALELLEKHGGIWDKFCGSMISPGVFVYGISEVA